MQRFYSIFSVFFLVFFGFVSANDPQDISQADINLSAECEPLATVAGCVNVLTGDFFLVETDMAIDAIEPLRFTRYYDSGHPFVRTTLGVGFACQFPLMATRPQQKIKGAIETNHHSHALIEEREGFFMPYKSVGKKFFTDYKLDKRIVEKGYTNLSRSSLKRAVNIASSKADYKSGHWVVRLSDGTKRLYDLDMVNIGGYGRNWYTHTQHALTQEITPNGNRLLFTYALHDKRLCPQTIVLLNRSKQIVSQLNCFIINAKRFTTKKIASSQQATP